tara:strand:+ start:1489 stop:1788 length:300 start_codon:yes stop_codon:yes gene_type:complete
MAYTQKLIQTRPNTDVDFFTQNADGVAKTNEYISAGKITADGIVDVISEDQLTKTSTMTFNTQEDYNAYSLESAIEQNKNARVTYCQNNSISWSREDNT